jgi:hypothetical protein
MSKLDMYPNLPDDVSIHHCNTDNVMPAEIADKVVELKQFWIHDDARETEESMEMDGSTLIFHCPNCKGTFTIFLGD